MGILLEAIGIVSETYFGFGFPYGFLIRDSLRALFSLKKNYKFFLRFSVTSNFAAHALSIKYRLIK